MEKVLLFLVKCFQPPCMPIYRATYLHEQEPTSSSEDNNEFSTDSYDSSTTDSSSVAGFSSDSDTEEGNFRVNNIHPYYGWVHNINTQSLVFRSMDRNNLMRNAHRACGYNIFERRICFRKTKFCVYCQENGEPEYRYRSHNLKDLFQRCTCPVLQLLICPICSATGVNAHTVQFCPYSQLKRITSMLAEEQRVEKIGKEALEIEVQEANEDQEVKAIQEENEVQEVQDVRAEPDENAVQDVKAVQDMKTVQDVMPVQKIREAQEVKTVQEEKGVQKVKVTEDQNQIEEEEEAEKFVPNALTSAM